MNYFSTQEQNEFKADFGFDEPISTKKECANPVFYDKTLHRVAIMKDFHCGSKGDIDENGVAGWVSKSICTGCGKVFKNKAGFYIDKKNN